jgi:cytochrome c-type biogenesis protein CcmH
MRRVFPGVAVVAVVALGLYLYPTAIVSAATRTSFTQVEGDVMCVVCHEPLAVAQSPEAFQERDYIRGLILQGKTRRQIENDLVQQYGPAVLAKPPAHGFNLVVWVVPPVAIVIAIVTLAFTLPRWRRRTRQATAADAARHDPAGLALTDADTRRLDEDLARDF